MKKFFAVIISAMLMMTTILTSCGKKEPDVEPPVIKLVNVDGNSIETNYVAEYEYPEATCKNADKKRVPVVVTAKGPVGDEEAEVKSGYLKPKMLGEYVLHYNATDKDGTKAKEVLFTVKFVDDGPEIELKEEAVGLLKIDKFTDYKIPEFTDVATISYPYKGWSDDDFTSTKTATFIPINAETGESIEDVNAIQRYELGVIEIKYILTAIADKNITKEYIVTVSVGDPLLGLVPYGDKATTTIEVIEDESISSSPIVKISAPFPVEDFGWPGAKIKAPGSLFKALNSEEDNLLVLNCYNPTNYWGKFYCTVYDDEEYTGIKGPYGRKYRVAPHSYFNIIVPRNIHIAGKINIMEISIEDTGAEELPEGELQDKPNPDIGWAGNEFYILSSNIIKESEVAENVWENNNMPILKAYTDQTGTTEEKAITIAKNEGELGGLKVTTTAEKTNFYIDFLSDPARKQYIMDEFANVRPNHKYDRSFTFRIHNLKEEPLKVWAMLGTNGNQNDTEEGKNWMYEITIPANDSRQIYYNSDSRSDLFDLNAAITCLRINTDQENSEFILNDVQILKVPSFDESPLVRFKITEIGGAHTDEALRIDPDKQWIAPDFTDLFETNYTAKTGVESVSYRETLDAEPVALEVGKEVTAKKGYYDVVYFAVEASTGDKFTRKVTFTAQGSFTAMEKPDLNKHCYSTEDYSIPTFDQAFSLATEHEGNLTSIEYRANAEANWEVIETINGIIETKAGEYKLNYEYKEIGGDNRSDTIYYLLKVRDMTLNASDFSGRESYNSPTVEDVVIDGNKFIKFSNYDFATGEYPGSTISADSEVMKRFLAARPDEGMKITVTNIDESKEFFGKFYMNSDGNTNAQFVHVLPGESGMVYFKNDGHFNDPAKQFGFWTNADKDGTITISIEFVKDRDFEVKMFDESKDGNEIASLMGLITSFGHTAPVVTYEDGAFKIDATAGDRYVDLVALKNKTTDYSVNINKYFAYAPKADRRFQVFAVDVKCIGADSGSIWVGIGDGANDINYNGNTREQKITSEWRTIYLPVGVMQTHYDNDNLSWVQLDVFNSVVAVKNFRVLNFAGIK